MKKAYRVKKSTDIELIMKDRVSVGDGYFVIYKKQNHENEHFRYAISVPKKYGNAVSRNLMKRRIREIIKTQSFVDDIDLFIIVKPKANNLSFEEIKSIIEKLFARAKIYKGRII